MITEIVEPVHIHGRDMDGRTLADHVLPYFAHKLKLILNVAANLDVLTDFVTTEFLAIEYRETAFVDEHACYWRVEREKG